MSYLAIARKYRPATFDEIVGQEHVTRTLRNAIAKNRIHHAFLFTGARGVGKTTAARALARSLNCAEGPTATPCGKCTSCIEVQSGASPDLIEIDGASNNSVEDVREIREAVRYAPTGGGWKIYLIDEVHMLSKGAFNALLKTLEEPPPHVLFVFATTEPNRIPDTILSRVQRFDFKRIPVPAIVARLKEIADSEGVTISETGLRLIAQSGEGSMRDAQSLFDQVISYSGSDIEDAHVVECLGLIDRGLLYEMLEAMLSGQPERCLDCISKAYANGYDLVRFSEEMLDILRNATFVRLSEGARKHVDLPPEELKTLLQLTAETEPTQLSRLFSALLDIHDRVSRANRPKIILEMSVAKLADIRPVQPIAALIERLEDLERRLSDGAPPPNRPGGRASSSRGPNKSQGGSGYSRGSSKTQALASEAPQAHTARASAHPASHLKLVVSEESHPKIREEIVSAPVESKPALEEAKPAPQPEPVEPEKSPWQQVQARLRGLDKSVDALMAGTPNQTEQTLSIGCPAGMEAALAKRALRRDDVLKAIKQVYGAELEIEVIPVRTAKQLTGQEAWIARAKANPAIRHLIEELGAEIKNITPHEDGETS